MHIVESLLERLRPFVGLKSWDYCVLWKLSEDQRFIEWMGCCCGGADQSTRDGGEEYNFPFSPVFPCRDVMLQHTRTKSCDLLSHLPSSMPLDSGIHAHTLISNQPRWLNHSSSSDSSVSDETMGTKVLIPMIDGLIELFVAKHVSEDQQIIDLVVAQCNLFVESNTNNTSFQLEQQPMFTSDHPQQIRSSWIIDMEGSSTPNEVKAMNGIQSMAIEDNLNMPNWDLSADQQQIRLGNNSPAENRYEEMASLQQSYIANAAALHPSTVQSKEHAGNEKDSVKQETARADSVSDCSDQIEDDDDQKVVGRSGRKHQSKNLMAERKRRKKLNDRLYTLRALVPKITKMDRASILGDAIEFVKELQKQAKELQDELEEPSDQDHAKNSTGGCSTNDHNDNFQSDQTPTNNNGIGLGANSDEAFKGLQQIGTMDNNIGIGGSSNPLKQNQELAITHEKAQQMEVQVEVAQLDGNEFFLKVFCEHKPGGFVRLMEALNSLGLEVTNANVTTFRGLVLNVFKVEKRDSEIVQADHVRDSLLELTRNLIGGWPEPGGASGNSNSMDYHYSHHHYHQPHN